MKQAFIFILFLGILWASPICKAQTPTGYAVTFYDKAPGNIDTTSLKEIVKQKNVKVNLSGYKENCKMTDFSITISDKNNNRPLYFEKIKGDKLSKEALLALKDAVPGNKVILSAFEVKCGRETEFIKEEFVYNIVE